MRLRTMGCWFQSPIIADESWILRELRNEPLNSPRVMPTKCRNGRLAQQRKRAKAMFPLPSRYVMTLYENGATASIRFTHA